MRGRDQQFRGRPRWRWVSWLTGFMSALVLGLALTLWGAGSVYSELPHPAELGPAYQPVDAIIVLTGGRGRIRKALELFEKGYGRMLYISGTDQKVQMKDILKELKWVGPVDESKIVLENISTNTVQNAEQATRYVRAQNARRVLLVTSIYHVRRAHYIFRKILPRDVGLEVAWFEANPYESSVWWKEWNGIFVTVSEFFKFYWAYLQLTDATITTQ